MFGCNRGDGTISSLFVWFGVTCSDKTIHRLRRDAGTELHTGNRLHYRPCDVTELGLGHALADSRPRSWARRGPGRSHAAAPCTSPDMRVIPNISRQRLKKTVGVVFLGRRGGVLQGVPGNSRWRTRLTVIWPLSAVAPDRISRTVHVL